MNRYRWLAAFLLSLLTMTIAHAGESQDAVQRDDVHTTFSAWNIFGAQNLCKEDWSFGR
jgi:hypothetical protein